MVAVKKQGAHTSGFALIVVLSTLAILTLLFAISTRLSLAHIQTQETEVLLAERSALNVALLRASTAPLAEARASGTYEVTVGDDTHTLRAVDVGGLVDLNTAQPPLLETYLTEIGLTNEEITRFRSWRQTSKRLLRIEDLIRVTAAQRADRALLLATATVHSGRTGVSLDDAPEVLRDLLQARWQDDWATAPSGVNFRIERIRQTGPLPVGVVNVRPDGRGKILWLGG